jgi:hypothetical protein
MVSRGLEGVIKGETAEGYYRVDTGYPTNVFVVHASDLEPIDDWDDFDLDDDEFLDDEE